MFKQLKYDVTYKNFMEKWQNETKVKTNSSRAVGKSFLRLFPMQTIKTQVTLGFMLSEFGSLFQ